MHLMRAGKFWKDFGIGHRSSKDFCGRFGDDPQLLLDIGMEVKGLEIRIRSQGEPCQQGGFAMAIKGPQNDEGMLFFMDMVNKQINNLRR